MEELGADALVRSDPARHFLNVGADLLAQVRDLVDEGDLDREEGVGGVFDQLGGLERRKHDRCLEQIERPVERPQHRARMLAVGANDDAIGPHKIGDRRTLAQEFGV